MASARANAARRKDAGGLGYLFARVWRELAERWTLELPVSGGAEAGAEDIAEGGAGRLSRSQSRVLLLDFDGADGIGFPSQWGEGAIIRRVSPLDSGGAAALDFRAPAGDGAPVAGGDGGDGGDHGFDGILLGLQVAWLEWEAVLAEALRTLRPGGRLLFCTFGPDTLQELRWAWWQVDRLPHVHPFTDMHLLGDQLLHCGFTRPIVDVDRVTVEYRDAETLFADLRGEGFTNSLGERRKTLTGKGRFAGFSKALDSLREPGAPLAITVELIYGVAIAPQPAGRVRVAPPEVRGAD